MAQEKSGAWSPLWREMFALGVYKRSQGRLLRQLTFGALALTIALGAWRLSVFVTDGGLAYAIVQSISGERNVSLLQAVVAVDRYVLPSLLLAIGLWISFRVVNYPRFADFLIAVEAEVNKVSWPSRAELVRSTIVVLLTIIVLAVILFMYDFMWRLLLQVLGVVGAGVGQLPGAGQ